MKFISHIKHHTSNIVHHPLMSGGIIMVGGNMAVNVINYGYHLIMGRVLGPVDYGVLASIYSILYLVGVIPSSASVAIVKFISSAKNEGEVYSIYKSLSVFVLYLAVFMSVALFIFSPLIADFLHIDNIWTVSLVSFVLFFSLITLVNQSTSQGLLKFIGSVGPSFVSAILKLILGIVLIWLGWSVFGAMVGIVAGAAVSYFYSLRFVRKILKESKFKKFILKPFFVYAFPVLVSALAFTSLFTADVILVKHFFSPFEAGIYAALSTLGKIIFFAAAPITATMFPIVAGRKARGEAHQKVFLVSLGLTALMAVAITGFYWLFPNIAIGVLYGPAYLSARSELVWMGIFILFYTLSNLLVNYSLSLGNTRIVVLPMLASIIQIVAIWVWHESMLQVIQISLTLATLVFLSLTLYLGYNRLSKRYAKQ